MDCQDIQYDSCTGREGVQSNIDYSLSMMFRWILSFCTKLRGKPGVFKRVHDKLTSLSLSLSLSIDTIKVEPVLSGTVLGHSVLGGRFSKSINFSPQLQQFSPLLNDRVYPFLSLNGLFLLFSPWIERSLKVEPLSWSYEQFLN